MTRKELGRENAELRALMQLQARPGQQVVHAALLYQGHDWFAQRITLDQGASSGVRSGLPVVDASGLVGQVSRVYPGSSEVTPVSSPEQLTPVFVERTGQRGLAAGHRTRPAGTALHADPYRHPAGRPPADVGHRPGLSGRHSGGAGQPGLPFPGQPLSAGGMPAAGRPRPFACRAGADRRTAGDRSLERGSRKRRQLASHPRHA